MNPTILRGPEAFQIEAQCTMQEFEKHLEEVFKSMYEFEATREDHLTQSWSLSFGVASVFAAIVAYYITLLPTVGDAHCVRCSLIFIIIALFVLTLTAGVLLVMAWQFHGYKQIASPAELQTFATDLRAHYQKSQPTLTAKDLDEALDSDLREYLIKKYNECAQKRRETNNKKHNFIKMSNRLLLIALCVVVVSIVPYAYIQLRQSPTPTDKK